MRATPDQYDLFDLLGALCDGTITPAQHEQLQQRLASDHESRQLYFEYVDLHLDLRRWPWNSDIDRNMSEWLGDDIGQDLSDDQGASDGCAPQSASNTASRASAIPFISNAFHSTVGFFSQEIPFSLLIASLVTGLGLWIGSLVYVSRPQPIARDAAPPRQPTFDPTLEVVGRITGMADCKWANDGREPFGYDNVLVGRRFKLDSGLMEITYNSGAKVILQGPVTYEVESRDGGFLSVGKLTARLEKRGEGREETGERTKNQKSPLPLPLSTFVVRTPMATVTDLGTEFGVNVYANHAAEVCVFDGKVEVAPAATDKSSKTTPQQLTAGEALRLEPAGDNRPLSAKSLKTSFVRKMPAAPRSRSGLEQGLVAYWSFDDAAHLGKNLTGGGDLTPTGTVSHETAGLIGGALCLSRDAKNDTLLFAEGRGVPKGVPTGDASYSISAWCRVDAVPANKTFDIVGWGEATVDPANALIHYGSSSEQCMVRNFWWNNDIAGFVGTSSMLGKWHHVVTTYDRRGRMQYLYLDRERIQLRGVENRPNFGSNNFAIGRRHPRMEPNVPLEWFGGLLDEIGIWNRELSEKEVAKLYNSGKGLNPLTLKNALEENAAR